MDEDALDEEEFIENALKSNMNSKIGRNKLERQLQKLLSSSRLFDEKQAELFYSLLSGNISSDEYLVKLKRYDNSPVCGLVWNANFFAYRCRDCGISPCMSLCADCFLDGNHEGHDFNMFKSQAGGACDCGDATVMRKEGFCCRHKTDGIRTKTQAPEDLVSVPKLALPILVAALYERLNRHMSSDNSADVLANVLSTSEVLLNVLNRLSKIEVLREIICKKIMSPIENSQTNSAVGAQSEVSSIVSPRPSDSWNIVCSTSDLGSTSVEVTVRNTFSLNESPPKAILDDHEQVAHSSIVKEGQKQTYIQFLMDILVKAEFPSKLATFLLQLLPNTTYKETFTRLFCRQYTAIGKSLSTSLNPDTLSNHMVHVSVQLFSNEYLALKMVKEENLLFKMIFILSKMIGECLENYSLEIEGHETSIMTVNCDHQILSGHRNWPIASDMTNILSHQSVAKMFLETGDCLSRWMHFVNMLTGMNINNRRFISHIEYEPRTYYTAFSIEFESAATVMWEIYRAIIKLDEKAHALKMVEVSAAALKDWYSFVPNKLNKSSFTFHLPLHRYFALFVSQAVNHFNEDIRKLLPINVILNSLGHLMNCAVALQEIRAGLWFYNGHQIRGQAQSYVQSYFCNSMHDLDIFFLQIAMSVMDPDAFLDLLLDRFCIKSWFQFGDAKIGINPSNLSIDNEKKLLLVEGCLNLILMLLSHRVYSGATEEEMLRKDLIASLCVADRTHSQLSEIIPTRPGDTHSPEKYFDKILAEVAYFKAPAVENSSMQQGMYTPKDSTWTNEYDYNHIQLRVFKKSDEQAAHERYNAIMQKNKACSTTLTWPPLHNLEKINPVFDGMYSVLKSQRLQKMLIFIIYQFVEGKQHLSESIIVNTIHLLQLSVWHENMQTSNILAKPNPSADDVLIDMINNYLDTSHDNEQRSVLADMIKEELKKDNDMQPFVDEFADNDDITFLIERKFHKTFFKPLCSYVQGHMSGAFSFLNMLKHIKTRLSQLPDKKLQLLKRLIQYWQSYCKKNSIDIEELPIVKFHSESKHFILLISILKLHLDYFFEVLTPIPGLPSSIFDISLPHSSITANAHVAINNNEKKTNAECVSEEMIDEASIDQFIDLTQCDRLSAIEWLRKGNYDMEATITLYFEQTSSDNLPGSSKTDSSQCSQCSSDTTPVHQDNDISLLTLLIKLRKIFTQASLPVKSKPKDGEIHSGNGAYYVNKLLKNLYRGSKKNAEILHRLCPDYKKTKIEDELMLSPEEKSKQARREKAKEKRKQLLMEFAQKQKKFLENIDSSSTMMVDGQDENCHSSDDETHCFECVICGQKNPSTEDNPIGLIVYLQPSTVLSNQHVVSSPCKQSAETTKCITYREILSKRQKALLSCYDSRSARSSFECGMDCGINIQSCRHYVHIDCQQSYFKALQDDHQRLINSDKGEFLCPLCRKLSNGVLSLLPTNLQQTNPKDSMENNSFQRRCEEISKYLVHFQQGGLTHFTARALEFTVLTASMATVAQSMEELIKSSNKATIKFYQGDNWKWSDKFFIMLASLRHNLESELQNMMITKTIPSPTSQTCLGAIMEAFHFHSQYVTSPMRLRWHQLCYGYDDTNETTNRRRSDFTYNGVPLLLVDPVSLLLQLVLTWPRRMTPDEFRCTVQLIYNLAVTQGLCVIGSQLQSQEKNSWQASAKDASCESLYALASTVWKLTTIFENENADSPEISQSVVSPHTIEMRLQQLCLPYLQTAFMLSMVYKQNYQFDVQLVDSSIEQQFQTLASILQLGEESGLTSSEISCVSYLRWATPTPLEVIKCWCGQVTAQPTLRDRRSSTDLLPFMLSGHPQQLIKLPKLYDSLFQEYRKRTCDRCKKTPDDPTVCLVCGAFLCFHNNCCRNKDDINECVAHSIECGCGTGVFLVISSSFTLVIRDERVCLWGSVYLDKHGEEDRDLKRGKPLYLNEERYQRLEKEWRTHSLDTSTKLWGLHLNRL